MPQQDLMQRDQTAVSIKVDNRGIGGPGTDGRYRQRLTAEPTVGAWRGAELSVGLHRSNGKVLTAGNQLQLEGWLCQFQGIDCKGIDLTEDGISSQRRSTRQRMEYRVDGIRWQGVDGNCNVSTDTVSIDGNSVATKCRCTDCGTTAESPALELRLLPVLHRMIAYEEDEC